VGWLLFCAKTSVKLFNATTVKDLELTVLLIKDRKHSVRITGTLIYKIIMQLTQLNHPLLFYVMIYWHPTSDTSRVG